MVIVRCIGPWPVEHTPNTHTLTPNYRSGPAQIVLMITQGWTGLCNDLRFLSSYQPFLIFYFTLIARLVRKSKKKYFIIIFLFIFSREGRPQGCRRRSPRRRSWCRRWRWRWRWWSANTGGTDLVCNKQIIDNEKFYPDKPFWQRILDIDAGFYIWSLNGVRQDVLG